jgi:hypothetical protein
MPFDVPEGLFEMKYDGYRGLLCLKHRKGRLILAQWPRDAKVYSPHVAPGGALPVNR